MKTAPSHERRLELYREALRDRESATTHAAWSDANDRCCTYGTPWWSDINPTIAERKGHDGPIPAGYAREPRFALD